MAAALELPTIFWLDCSDTFLTACRWVGFALSVALLLGLANVPLLAGLLDFCVFAPLFGLPFMGRQVRQM